MTTTQLLYLSRKGWNMAGIWRNGNELLEKQNSHKVLIVWSSKQLC